MQTAHLFGVKPRGQDAFSISYDIPADDRSTIECLGRVVIGPSNPLVCSNPEKVPVDAGFALKHIARYEEDVATLEAVCAAAGVDG